MGYIPLKKRRKRGKWEFQIAENMEKGGTQFEKCYPSAEKSLQVLDMIDSRNPTRIAE
jgi:hypothetical protein